MPGSTVTFQVTASVTGGSGTPTVSMSDLPTGLTSTTTFPLTVPPAGAAITLNASTNLAANSYTVTLSGQAGSVSGTAQLTVKVQTGTAGFNFTSPTFRELNVQNGGFGQIAFGTQTGFAFQYDISLSVTGLPNGVTATISPNSILPGQSTTVTLNATSNAPFTQNVTVTLTGTPQATVASQSIDFFVDVNQGPGTLPNNRTDYLSTEGSPYAAVYDPAHNLIFASNPSWDRVDVISVSTHKLVKGIPVRGPRGIDITPSNAEVWVATDSQLVISIDTTTLSATTYDLPTFSPYSSLNWQGSSIFALADGTVALIPSVWGIGSVAYLVVWNPQTNSITSHQPPGSAGFGYVQRTGDGKRIYSIDGTSADNAFYYDVVAKTFSQVKQVGSYAAAFAVNFDSSRVVIFDYQNGLNMYDGNFNLIGPLPGGGVLATGFQFEGGLLFSSDNQHLYEVCMPQSTPVILTIDTSSLQVAGIAPALPLIPVGVELGPPFYMPEPFGIDPTGLLLGVEYYGIAFDDSTFNENSIFATPNFLQHMSPYSGPLAGGTTSGGFGNAFSLTPDVWYGSNRGKAHIDQSNALTITSPAGSAPGPVNIKFLFPDGIEVFDPLFFSYGPSIQNAVISGGSPQGGAVGEIAGYGLPTTSSAGTVSVGGNSASILSSGQITSTYGYPFPANTVKFNVPSCAPGLTQIAVNTPDGNTTFPNSFYYAQSVTDYSSSDTFTAVLYDGPRQQLYLSAGDHIDVFSLTSNQFSTPLVPASLGNTKEFAGLALTPTGLLLATDLSDGSLSVIDPGNPANTSAIFVVTPSTSGQNCNIGPSYVAATNNNQAFVSIGTLPAGCSAAGGVVRVDLPSGTTSSVTCGQAIPNGTEVQATDDGSKVAIGGGDGFCIFNVSQQKFYASNFYGGNAATFSGDGNIAASQWFFLDSFANLIGEIARSDVFYGALGQNLIDPNFYLLPDPRLNTTGSLYFIPYPDFLDIVDVQHGTLRLRFSLTETITNAAVPLATDLGGQNIYLLTNKGLTIVNLGEAPLSVGWINPVAAGIGTTVNVRGSGFNASTQVKIAGSTASTNFVDAITVSFVVPTLSSGPKDIVLTNSDGALYTFENGLRIP
jgi:hypothetical protein